MAKSVSTAIDLPKDVHEKLQNSLFTSIDTAMRANKRRLDRIRANRKLLDPQQRRANKPHKTACELHVPVIRSAGIRVKAAVMASVFNAKPLATVTEFPQTTASQRDEQLEQVIQAVALDQMDFKQKSLPVIEAGLFDCTGVAHLYWSRETAQVPQWAVNPETNQYAMGMSEQVTYDGPMIQYIPIERFGIWPADADSVDTASGVWVVERLTGDALLQMVAAGTLDKAAVAKLADYRTAPDMNGEQASSNSNRRQGVEEDTNTPDEFQLRPYAIHVIRMRVPLKTGEPSAEYRLHYHMATRAILGAEKMNGKSTRRRYLLYRPFRDAEGIYGDSFADLLGDPQRAMTVLLRQIIDQASFDISPPGILDPAMWDEKDLKNFEIGPGEMKKIAGGDPARAIHFPYKPSQVSLGVQTMTFLRSMYQEMIGITDDMFTTGGKSMTATEAQARASFTAMLFEMIVDSARQYVTEFTKMLLDLMYEYAPNMQQYWAMIVGEGQPADFATVIEKLGKKYQISVSATTEVMRDQRRTLAREVYERLLMNPLVQNDLELLYQVTRWYLAEMGVPVPEELVGTVDRVKQTLALMASAQQTMKRQEEEDRLRGEAEAIAAGAGEAAGGTADNAGVGSGGVGGAPAPGADQGMPQ